MAPTLGIRCRCLLGCVGGPGPAVEWGLKGLHDMVPTDQLVALDVAEDLQDAGSTGGASQLRPSSLSSAISRETPERSASRSIEISKSHYSARRGLYRILYNVLYNTNDPAYRVETLRLDHHDGPASAGHGGVPTARLCRGSSGGNPSKLT